MPAENGRAERKTTMSQFSALSISFSTNMAEAETSDILREMVVSAANEVLPLAQRERFQIHLRGAQGTACWALFILLDGQEAKAWAFADSYDHAPEAITTDLSVWLRKWLRSDRESCQECQRFEADLAGLYKQRLALTNLRDIEVNGRATRALLARQARHGRETGHQPSEPD